MSNTTRPQIDSTCPSTRYLINTLKDNGYQAGLFDVQDAWTIAAYELNLADYEKEALTHAKHSILCMTADYFDTHDSYQTSPATALIEMMASAMSTSLAIAQEAAEA